MQTPITIFPTEEMTEKMKSKMEELDMTEEEYFAYLMEKDSQDEDEDEEEEDEENEEEDEFSEVLAGITDVSDKDSIIKELKIQVKAREEEVFNVTQQLDAVTNYPRINLMFDVVRGHTLRIGDSKEKIVIEDKADLIHCLVKNFHWTFDCEDFGIEQEDFNEMEKEHFKEDEVEETED